MGTPQKTNSAEAATQKLQKNSSIILVEFRGRVMRRSIFREIY